MLLLLGSKHLFNSVDCRSVKVVLFVTLIFIFSYYHQSTSGQELHSVVSCHLPAHEKFICCREYASVVSNHLKPSQNSRENYQCFTRKYTQSAQQVTSHIDVDKCVGAKKTISSDHSSPYTATEELKIEICLATEGRKQEISILFPFTASLTEYGKTSLKRMIPSSCLDKGFTLSFSSLRNISSGICFLTRNLWAATEGGFQFFRLLLQVDRMHSNRCIQKWRQNDVLREEHLKWCLSRDFLMQQKCPVLVQPVLIFFETKHIQRKMLQTFERSVFKGKLTNVSPQANASLEERSFLNAKDQHWLTSSSFPIAVTILNFLGCDYLHIVLVVLCFISLLLKNDDLDVMQHSVFWCNECQAMMISFSSCAVCLSCHHYLCMNHADHHRCHMECVCCNRRLNPAETSSCEICVHCRLRICCYCTGSQHVCTFRYCTITTRWVNVVDVADLPQNCISCYRAQCPACQRCHHCCDFPRVF